MAIRPHRFVGDPDNGVEMVRHDYVWPDLNFRPNCSSFDPFIADDDSALIQEHLIVYWFTKKELALVGDHGDEVCAWLRIVEAGEAYGAAMMGGGVGGHDGFRAMTGMSMRRRWQRRGR